MKRLFILAAATAVAMSSCSENEIVTTADSQNAISFSTYAANATKAIEDVDYTKLQANGFTVSSVHYDGTADVKLFENVVVDYGTTTSGAWDYNSTKQNWPASATVDFVAVGRGNTTNSNNTHSVSMTKGSSATSATFTTTTGTKGSTQQYIVVATAWDQTAASSDGAVSLTFRHAMSKIAVKVTPNTTTKDLTLQLTSIVFKSLNTVGTATISNNEGEDIVWGSLGTSSDMTVELNTIYTTEDASGGDDDGIATTGSITATNVLATGGELVIIPQALSTVTISYIWYSGEMKLETVENKSINLYTDSSASNNFITTAVNTLYTFDFKITPNAPISFTVTDTVDAWTDTSTSTSYTDGTNDDDGADV